MKYRVYTSDRQNIISGYVTEEMLNDIRKYQDFFKENDTGLGEGIYEADLPSLNSTEENKRNIVLKATAEEIKFGVYGYEGWEPIFQEYLVENDKCQVVFDRMIMYYVYEDKKYDEYDKYLSYQEAINNIHIEDKNIFNNLLDSYEANQE
jgi:hypothetical protein